MKNPKNKFRFAQRVICFILHLILTEAKRSYLKKYKVKDHVSANPTSIDSDLAPTGLVNFFTIGKEGIFDPIYNLKRPIDFDYFDPRVYQPPPPDQKSNKEIVKFGSARDSSGGFKYHRFLEDSEEFALNWTSCKEFGMGAYFHPQEVLNIEWIPFYVWSFRLSEAIVHKFSVPKKKLVQQYKTQYDKFLSEPVDWKAPKLLLTEDDEKETLLIADGRNGLFKGIMKVDIHPTKHRFTITVSHRMFKIEAPYLLMTSCDFSYAAALAPLGAEPDTDEEKTNVGKKLNFKGIGMPVSRSPMSETIRAERWQWKKVAMERATVRNFKK